MRNEYGHYKINASQTNDQYPLLSFLAASMHKGIDEGEKLPPRLGF